MYSYIKGTVEEIYLDRIVLENNGIGYEINVSSFTAQSVQKGKDAKIFTKLIVREDDMSLWWLTKGNFSANRTYYGICQ